MAQLKDELNRVLPPSLPHREIVLQKAAQHLKLIEEANRHFNLTRINDGTEAAIKHVLDSVMPWQLVSGSAHVLDAGTGPGFPGIPLAIVHPGTRFTLAESIQKKARFVDTVREQLTLTNVKVAPQRAEDLLRTGRFDVIVARALAPLSRAVGLLAPALKAGTKVLMYKGPDAEQEMGDAVQAAQKVHARMQVVMRYELPESLGTRTIVQITG